MHITINSRYNMSVSVCITDGAFWVNWYTSNASPNHDGCSVVPTNAGSIKISWVGKRWHQKKKKKSVYK